LGTYSELKEENMTMTRAGRCCMGAMVLALGACASTTKPGAVGVGRQQLLTVPAAEVEARALAGYTQQNEKARSAGRLVSKGAELERLTRIAARLQAQVPVFRDDTAHWAWQVSLIDAPVMNATCAPGGKITFYTGLIRQLRLTDDEIAMIMGHEIAHALREHGRERLSQAKTRNTVAALLVGVAKSPPGQVEAASGFAHYFFELPNSRQHETEADTMGLELGARAGYDPQAAIAVWKKMSAQSGGKQTAEFLSTHPSNASRIAELSAMLPRVVPLYEAATRN
jgi:Zn-dependent protease with chaperone function